MNLVGFNMPIRGKGVEIDLVNCLEIDANTDHIGDANKMTAVANFATAQEANMEKKDKPLSEWTLGDVKTECRGRTPADGTGCIGCQLNGKVCDVSEDGIILSSPDGWEIDDEAEAKPNREVLDPSLTGEAQTVGVGVESKPARPMLAELLGVEEDEEWMFPGIGGPYRVHNGLRQFKAKDGDWVTGQNEALLATIIAQPEKIIRTPRLTEAELAIMRATGAKWVTRPISIGFGFDFKAFLWKEKPQYLAGDKVEQSWVAAVSTEIFKSVHPGDCICAEEAGGE